MNHLRYAVTDGSDGTAAVALPSLRAAALRMKVSFNHMFWCSRAIGGCGARLVVAAGEVRAPYFRHKQGEKTECALELDPRRADEPHRHLAAQRALVAWIEAQGHQARIEYPVAGGRADVHVVIDNRRHSLEVQISPITEAQWKRRDSIYRSQMDGVTWLFGDELGTRATEELLRHDVSFHIHVDHDLEVALGTRFVDDHIAWDELHDCKLTVDGLWTPHSSAAVASSQRWRSLTAVAEALHAELRRRDEMEALARKRRRAEEAARRRLAASQQMPLMPRPQAGRSARMPSMERNPWTREARAALSGEADGWTPPIGWAWLENVPRDLQPSAQLLAYYVCCIYAAGPVDQLSFDDVPDPNGYQVEALAAAGFITCYEVRGVRRWRRAEDC